MTAQKKRGRPRKEHSLPATVDVAPRPMSAPDIAQAEAVKAAIPPHEPTLHQLLGMISEINRGR